MFLWKMVVWSIFTIKIKPLKNFRQKTQLNKDVSFVVEREVLL